MTTVVLWLVTIIFFTLGMIGIVVPALPGTGLVFIGILFYAMMTNFAEISAGFVIGSGIVALGAWLVEYMGAVIGAKVGGGGKFTLAGTIAGALLGLVAGGPVGLLAGVVAGAALGAVYEGKTAEKAGKAALCSIVGIVGAKIVQATLTVGLVLVFLLVAVF